LKLSALSRLLKVPNDNTLRDGHYINSLKTEIGICHEDVAVVLHIASLLPIDIITVAAVGGHRQILHAQLFVEYETAQGLDLQRYCDRDCA